MIQINTIFCIVARIERTMELGISRLHCASMNSRTDSEDLDIDAPGQSGLIGQVTTCPKPPWSTDLVPDYRYLDLGIPFY